MFNFKAIDREDQSRSDSAIKKVERLQKAARMEEPDRIPMGEFFWGGFVSRWKKELGLPDNANPYYYYDLDWIVVNPNMDPHIRQFETLLETETEVQVKTGFEVIMRKKYDFPMPEMMRWEVDTIQKLLDFKFDDPYDRRRYFETHDDHINGVGDGFERNTPPWIERVQAHRPDFAVFGSVAEISECLTRLIGQENAMLWMLMHYEEFPLALEKI